MPRARQSHWSLSGFVFKNSELNLFPYFVKFMKITCIRQLLLGWLLLLPFVASALYSSAATCNVCGVDGLVEKTFSSGGGCGFQPIIEGNDEVDFQSGKEIKVKLKPQQTYTFSLANSITTTPHEPHEEACGSAVVKLGCGMKVQLIGYLQGSENDIDFNQGWWDLKDFAALNFRFDPDRRYVLNPTGFKVRLDMGEDNESQSGSDGGNGDGGDNGASLTGADPTVMPGTPAPTVAAATSSLTIPLGKIAIGSGGTAPYRSAGVLFWNGTVAGTLAQPSHLEYLSLSEVQTLTGEFGVSFAEATPIPGNPVEKHLVTPTRLFRITGFNSTDPDILVNYNTALCTYVREYVRETRTEDMATTLGKNPVSWYRIEPDTEKGVKLTKSIRGWCIGKSVKAPNANELIIDDGLNQRVVAVTNPAAGGYEKTETTKRNGVVVSLEEKEYSLIEGKYRLVEERKYADPVTAEGAMSTNYSYYVTDLDWPEAPVGKLRWISYPDGDWKFYRYSGDNSEVFTPFASETKLDSSETNQSVLPISLEAGDGRYVKVVNYPTVSVKYVSSDPAGYPSYLEEVEQIYADSGGYSAVTNQPSDAVFPDGVPLMGKSDGTYYSLLIDATSQFRWLAGEPILTWDGNGGASFHEYMMNDERTIITKISTTGYTDSGATSGKKVGETYFVEVPGHSERTIRTYGPQGQISEEHLYNTGVGYTSASLKQIQYNLDGSYASTTTNDVITHAIQRLDNDPYTTIETDAAGRSTTTVRNAWGEVVSVTEAAGGGVPAQTTTYEIDGLKTSTFLNGALISVVWVDGLGRTVSHTDETGAVTSFTYSAGGRITEERLPGDNIPIRRITTRYWDGKIMSVSGNGAVNEFHTHDLLPGGIVSETSSFGSASHHTPRQTITKSSYPPRTLTVIRPSPAPGGGLLETKTVEVDGQSSITTVTALVGTSSTLLSRRLDREFLGNGPASGLPGSTRYVGFDMNDDSKLTFGSGDRFTKTEWLYVKDDDNLVFRKTISHQYPDGSDVGELVSETWERLSFVADGTNGYEENLKNVKPSGRTVTTTTTVNRSAVSAVTVVDDSATPGVDSTTTSENGRVTRVQRSGYAKAESYQYDSFGVLVKVTDSRGAVSRTINQNFQVDKTIDHLGRETSYTYYPPGAPNAGRIHKVIHPGGADTETVYTDLGQIKEIKGSAEYRRVYDYDPLYGDQLTLQTFGTVPATTRWVYQEATGVLKEKRYNDAEGTGYQYQYTPDGKIAKRISARGVVTDYGYDSATRDLLTVDYSEDDDLTPDLIFSDYDSFGRPKTVKEALGSQINEQTLTYQKYSEAVSMSYKPTHQWLPKVSIQHEPDDALGRPTGFNTKVDGSSVASQTYGYDEPLGRLHRVSSGDLVADIEYLEGSGVLRKQTVKTTSGQSIHERRLSIDMLSRTAGVENRVPQSGPGTTWTTVASIGHAFDLAGRRQNATRDDGTAWEYTYNNRSEVEGAEKKVFSGETVPGLDFTYTYDGIGNRKTSTIGSHNHFTELTYTPDALNQFTQVTHDGDFWALVRSDSAVAASATSGATVQGISQEGNLYGARLHLDNSEEEGGGKMVKSSFTRDGVPAAGGVDLWIPDEITHPHYDDDGNLQNDVRWVYTWDGENRLVSMVPTDTARDSGNAPNVEVHFYYDYLSRRIGKSVVGFGTHAAMTKNISYAYDGWNCVAEWERSGSTLILKHTHLWGLDIGSSGDNPNLQAAGGVAGLIGSTYHNCSIKEHFLPSYDANGNIIAWSDGIGTLVQRRDYDPFGNAVLVENLGTPEVIAKLPTHGFSTKPQDAETGLYYYGYRYYDPVTGRWPSRDPIEERGGVNLFRFLDNNSIFKYDMLGCAIFDATQADEQISGAANHTLTNEMKDEVRKFVTDLQKISEKDFNDAEKTFDGGKVNYDKATYIKKVRRELDSEQVFVNQNLEAFRSQMTGFAKKATEPYDYVHAAVHGSADLVKENGKEVIVHSDRLRAKFNRDDLAKVMYEVNKMTPAHVSVTSCFAMDLRMEKYEIVKTIGKIKAANPEGNLCAVIDFVPFKLKTFRYSMNATWDITRKTYQLPKEGKWEEFH